MKIRDYLWLTAVAVVLIGWAIDAYLLHMSKARHIAQWKRNYQEQTERWLVKINRVQMLYEQELARQAMDESWRTNSESE